MKNAPLLRPLFHALALAGLTAFSASAQIVIDDPIPPPAFTPAPPEAFADSLFVVLAAPTPGASLYFTLDGTAPTTSSIRYTGPIRISATTTLHAIAVRNSQRSAVVTAVYTKTEAVATPVASPPGRALHREGTPLTITLTTPTPGASIHYTLDGSSPDSGAKSRLYTAPFVIAEPTVLKAVAVKWGMVPSKALVETYASAPPAPISAPAISPAGGKFLDSIRVAFAHPEMGASIFFTLDGSDPSPSSSQFQGGALTLVQSATVKVVAIRDGRRSEVMTAFFERVATGIRDPLTRTRASRFHPVWAWERQGRRLDGAAYR